MQSDVKLGSCTLCSRPPGYRREMPGDKGWRSPVPDWWVERARERLGRRQLTLKTLAQALAAHGIAVSEMMVIRALHEDPTRRVATLETLNAISDALGLPRPIVVADSFELALELQSAVAFRAADADAIRIRAEVERERGLRPDGGSVPPGRNGRTTADEVADSRAKTARSRPPALPRAPRAR